MRWSLGTLAALVVALAIYLGSAAASLSSLAAAARAGDGAKVLEHTDVKALNRSLTNQILAAYFERIGATRRISPAEKMLINTYGASIADAMVAKMLTADRLTQMLKTGNLDGTAGLPSFAGLPALANLQTGDWLSLLKTWSSRCCSASALAKPPTPRITPRSTCILKARAGSFQASNCRRRSSARSQQACRLGHSVFERSGHRFA
jgi:hypothetical protein